MRGRWLAALTAGTLLAAGPVITELEPRGAQRGRPFTLTVLGRDIPEGARVWSTMPAAFTPLVPPTGNKPMLAPGRAAQFLVEPAEQIEPGVYPIRLETPAGISNVLLFTVGPYPEYAEQESGPYSEPNRNDTIETAEPVPATPVTINGTLQGPERDLYRVYAKAGERRVFEVEARRCGSAIDPVLRILDGAGNQLARSDDAPLAALDARIDFTFPREAYYYVEVHDARFRRQVQNFYRLKIGDFRYADGIFPLGGRRGEVVTTELYGGNLAAPVKKTVDLRNLGDHVRLTTVEGFVFAVSDYPELTEPGDAVSPPVVLNGRLAEPGEVDRYQIAVEPGERLLFEVEARQLGTSRLQAVITVYDEAGRRLASAGDEPLPEDVFAVQGTSRTSNDPFLNLTVPAGTRRLTLTVEDLALRGGPHYPYRLLVRRESEDFELTVATPYVNVPAGGTAAVVVTADRRGYDGPIQLSIPDLPAGLRIEGGRIPREQVDDNNARTLNRRGVLILSAEPDAEWPRRELVVWGEGVRADGARLRRRARGVGMVVEVAGATAQGAVDRQRPLVAPWLGLDLVAALTTPPPGAVEVRQLKVTRMEEGDRFDFQYEWKLRTKNVELPEELAVDVVGARDIRVTAFQRSGETGSFSINTTKATEPASYDLIVRGRLKADGRDEEIYARPLVLVVTGRGESVQVSSAN